MANEYGNYATLNPLYPSSNVTLSNGNLTATFAGSGHYHFPANMLIPATGKWALKATDINSAGRPSYQMIGVIEDNPASLTDAHDNATSVYWTDQGVVYRAGSSLGVQAATYTQNDVLEILYDRDAATLKLYKGGVLSYTVTSVPTTANVFSAVANEGGTAVWTLDFGQNGYTATDTDYLNLSTANLPTPSVINYEDEYYIQAGISHSNGSTTAVTLPKTVSGGAMVRIKETDAAVGWYVFDTVRGANKFFFWNTNAAEDTSTFDDQNLTGTTLTLPSDLASGTYLVEVFYVGSYFKIIEYAGNGGSGTRTYAHGASEELGFAVTMRVSAGAAGHAVAHKDLTSANWFLDSTTTAAQADYGSAFFDISDGTNITIDRSSSYLNTDGADYVTYAWANSGPYAFGSYTGNGNADGPMINVGGFPTTTMIKVTSGVNDWDLRTQPIFLSNASTEYIYLDTTAALDDGGSGQAIDLLSNGAKVRNPNNANNTSSGTYIYGAFGIQPLTDGSVNQGRAK